MHKNDVKTFEAAADDLDQRYTYFFNKELDCIIMATYWCEIRVFRPYE